MMKGWPYALLLVFLTLSGSSQDLSAHFGVGAGVNISNMSITSNFGSISPSSKVGFKGYIFYDFSLSKSISIQSEFGYDEFGYIAKAPMYYTVDATQQLNYLDFAILPKLKINKTNLSFFVGPSLGYVLNGQLKNKQGFSYKNADSFNSLDVSGVVGTEYYTNFGLGISIRYLRGLTNIAKNIQYGEDTHNYSFAILLAYRIDKVILRSHH